MDITNQQIDIWDKEYNGSVPISVLRDWLQPTRLDYVVANYFYDHVMDALVRRKDNTIMDTGLIYCGKDFSGIPLNRAKWMVRMGDDPWKVRNTPGRGLWAQYGPDDKIGVDAK